MIAPYILLFIGTIGIILGLTLLLTKPKPTPKVKTLPIKPLGDLHVCVSQIKEQIKKLPTDNHSKFCKALKNGFHSKCNNLKIQMVDEAGFEVVQFEYSNGGYIPKGDINCEFKGRDTIVFKVYEINNQKYIDETWVQLLK